MTPKIGAVGRIGGFEVGVTVGFNPTALLYDESVTGAQPRFLDLVGSVIEKVFTGIGKRADDAFRGSRARVIENYTLGESGVGPEYGIRDAELLKSHGYIPDDVKPAWQGWLQGAVGKVGKYVAGAYVPSLGIYIDKDLLRYGAEYVRHVTSGVASRVREAGKYAGDFIETILTGYHEEEHARGVESEYHAEGGAKRKLFEYLAPRNHIVRRALDDYIGGGYRERQLAYAPVPV